MKKQTSAVKRDDGWKGYVNWSPTVSERAKVVEFMGNGSFDPMDYILQFDESGYSSSFGYDEKNSCHRLSVTGKGDRCPNIGYTLSVRASSPQRCVALAAYYIYVICESGDWLVDKAGSEVW